jgi:hypothetical protein
MARVNDLWRQPLTLLAACAWISACGPAQPAEDAAAVALSDPTLVEPAVPADTDPPVEPAAPSLAVSFAVAAQDGSLAPAAAASLVATQAVYVVAEWRGLTGSPVEQLELVAPSGSLYHSTSFSLVPGDTAPLRVEALEDGALRATFRVAIWGTSIAQLQRTGTWTATVGLADGPLSATATIDLQP